MIGCLSMEGTVRYVQLRGSAQKGSYTLSSLHAPMGTHSKLGDVENNFCRTSSGPIAAYSHKMVKMLFFPSFSPQCDFGKKCSFYFADPAYINVFT